MKGIFLMYKLYDWLFQKLPMSEDAYLIDVGAYHGDFSESLLHSKKISKAILFEPNPEHFSFLENKFKDQENIFLHQYALGNQNSSSDFNCSEDDATGSLLSYHEKYHHENTNKRVHTFSVEVKKLDDIYEKYFPHSKLSLIKVDTQGFDLEVLKGAEKLIREHKPWLVIELNFLPFYSSQASIPSIFKWLSDCGYTLGGFFNDHYSKEKWLAFADGVFIPEENIKNINEPFVTRAFDQDLISKNNYLQNVCEERMKLIHSLSAEAETRLEIINDQQKTIENLKRKRKKLIWF